jgi:uncharacterized repeat protein (TIGR03943 family)
MDDRTQGALLLAVGGICLRLGLTDVALAYVKAGLQPPLTISGVVLLVLGVGAIRRGFRADRGDAVATDDLATTDHAALHGYAAELQEDEAVAEAAHDHGHGPAVAWLLVAPLLALLLIAPPPLGAFAAGRQSSRPPETTQTTYPPLPDAEDGAIPLRMTEFVFRALYDQDGSLEGARARLVGFVTPVDDGEGYLLTRFTLNCCAADATAVSVRVVGDPVPREPDTWLEVEGEWEPHARPDGAAFSHEPPVLRFDSAREVAEPSPPYDY